MDTITRQDQYFDAMSGGSSEIPEPITRKEKFYAKMAGEDVDVPEPITREEFWLHKIIEHGGGGSTTTIEPLTVTENGSYSETGKAYSPVNVNVPNPSTGTLNITENGTYDVTEKASAVVNVSGSSFTPKFGIIRPDAELVQEWTYDQLAVQDLGKTLPAYVTSAKEIMSTKNLATVQLDYSRYRYILLQEALSIPIKSEWVHEAGAFEYGYSMQISEPCFYLPNIYKSFDGTMSTYGNTFYSINATDEKIAYDNSADYIYVGNMSYGIYPKCIPCSLASDQKLTIKSPTYYMRGSSTYFTSADWARVTDIRMQYYYALYRVAADATYLDGWTGNMFAEKIISDIANGGTLT